MGITWCFHHKNRHELWSYAYWQLSLKFLTEVKKTEDRDNSGGVMKLFLFEPLYQSELHLWQQSKYYNLTCFRQTNFHLLYEFWKCRYVFWINTIKKFKMENRFSWFFFFNIGYWMSGEVKCVCMYIFRLGTVYLFL